MFDKFKSRTRDLARSASEMLDNSAAVKALLRRHLERERVVRDLAVARVEREKALLAKEVERLKSELETTQDALPTLRAQAKQLRAVSKAGDRYKAFPPRHQRIERQIREVIERAGISKGSMLEVGGRRNSFRNAFPEFDYTNLDLAETGPGVLKADITGCPEISSARYDVIISIDVFEHINRPWLAASEIVRLLKSGGVTYHSTLFSWRYHPCPIDYWRFTPDALAFLFSDLDPICSGFDSTERRRNNLGKGKHVVEKDALGGWRENWRVFYAGRKVQSADSTD